MLLRFIFVFLALAYSAVADDLGAWGGGDRDRSFFCSQNANPCINDGICVDAKTIPSLENSYQCDCRLSRCSGGHCENCPPAPTMSPQGPCNPNPCQGDCQCQPSCKHSDGYYCRSSSGYLGKDCTIPPPKLDCFAQSMVVTINKRFVDEFDLGLLNSFLVVQPGLSTMPATNTMCMKRMSDVVGDSYVFTFPLPFTGCGTVSLENPDNSVTFRNQIWFNRDLTPRSFDVPIPAIAFECRYSREYKIVTSLQPFVPTPPTIRGEFSVRPSISLCKSEACPSACPSHLQVNPGSVYTVGEIIHVTMSLDTGSHVTTVSKMFISCSGTPGDNSVVQIVENGCGSLSGLPCKVTHNGASHTVCVSFQTPRSLSCNQIYIHATLASCTSQSLQTCPGSATERKCSNRMKRSAGETEEEEVFGPFYVISASNGTPHLEIFPDSDTRMELTQTKNNYSLDVMIKAAHDLYNKDTELEEPDDDTSVGSSTLIITVGLVAVSVLLIILSFAVCMYMQVRKSSALISK